MWFQIQSILPQLCMFAGFWINAWKIHVGHTIDILRPREANDNNAGIMSTDFNNHVQMQMLLISFNVIPSETHYNLYLYVV